MKMRWRANPLVFLGVSYVRCLDPLVFLGVSYVRCLDPLVFSGVSYTRYLSKHRTQLTPLKDKWISFSTHFSSQAPDIAHPKKISALARHLIFHRFSPFDCCLSVVL